MIYHYGIDEKQVATNNNNFIDNVIYMLGLGASKLRGAKNGGLQSMQLWRSIILTTGEEPLTQTTSETGVATRVIEIYGAPFVEEIYARKMHQVADENYGLAGPLFIQKLIENSDNLETIKEQYRAIQERLQEETMNKIGSHITAVSLIILADQLVNKYIFEEADEEASYIMGKRIIDNLVTSKEADLVEKAYEYISSWIVSNTGSFDNSQEYPGNSNNVRYGLITGGNYYIFPHILENELEKKGFSYRKVIKGWAERGYIIQDSQGKNQVVKKYKGQCIRFICFLPKEADCPF